jgi:hypothetical protein
METLVKVMFGVFGMCLLIMFVFAGSSCVGGCDRGYSEGVRSGQVIKFSRKGVAYKSYEGSLNLGGMSKDSDGSLTPNTWEFTVIDPAVVKQVSEAQESGQHVSLHYVQWLVSPLSMGSEYEVDEVRK